MEDLVRAAGFEAPSGGTGYLAKWMAARAPAAAASERGPTAKKTAKKRNLSRRNSLD
jgi:hypothetical protein